MFSGNTNFERSVFWLIPLTVTNWISLFPCKYVLIDSIVVFDKSKLNWIALIVSVCSLLNTVFKTLQGKEEYRQFYDLLIVVFKETIKVKYKAQTVLSNYDKILNKLISLNNIEDKVLTLMDARNEINFNLNLNLLTYSTFNKIFGN